jgi:hypothetical protein
MLSNIRAGKATIYGYVARAETSLFFYRIADSRPDGGCFRVDRRRWSAAPVSASVTILSSTTAMRACRNWNDVIIISH